MAEAGTLGHLIDQATRKDPREVLLQQVHEAAAMAAATRELAGDIDLEALHDPNNEGHAKAAQTHELFRVWQERATKTSKMALDVGIDEAMVKLAELQAKAMVGLLKRVLASDILGLDQRQQKMAQALLGQGLRDLVPDVSTTKTVELHVDGETIPYNPAMDMYITTAGDQHREHYTEYRSARKARLREEARIGGSSAGSTSEPGDGGS